MTKVIVAGSKDYMGLAIDALHKHNVMHITDFVKEDDDFRIGKPYASASKLSERAISLRSIASYLSITGKEDTPSSTRKALLPMRSMRKRSALILTLRK